MALSSEGEEPGQSSWLISTLRDIDEAKLPGKTKWRRQQQAFEADRRNWAPGAKLGEGPIKILEEVLEAASTEADVVFSKAHRLQADLAGSGRKDLAREVKRVAAVRNSACGAHPERL